VLTALVVAGLPSDRFFFEGFLPHKSAARQARIAELAAVPGTLVFYEGNSRVAAMLADLARILGDRPAVVARELTKKFEQVRRGTLRSLAGEFATEGPPKGEIVVLVAPPDGDVTLAGTDEIDERLRGALQSLGVKDAASTVAAETGHKRRDIYVRAIEIAAAVRTAKLDAE
ncbi:MAG: SAM-dependent methyltransferase, partial [Beijerinckiaceae bacterium]|nr:SAM-dependent methyltransferase [Beijerinckiaceae bacterium]